MRTKIHRWRIPSTRATRPCRDSSRGWTDPVVRGWMNYYGRFYRSKCVQVLRHPSVAVKDGPTLR
ncbi:group II intron maturase-specific domain-containing protein [Nannocystis sp.]|uniref:group II intron maturase-specific domain-containing protein n=1 Tax=Nannocystis sp. TaxID=1962667 RepID=UPI00344CF1A2